MAIKLRLISPDQNRTEPDQTKHFRAKMTFVSGSRLFQTEAEGKLSEGQKEIERSITVSRRSRQTHRMQVVCRGSSQSTRLQ